MTKPDDDEQPAEDGEAKRPYHEVFAIERAQGLVELRRPVGGLALSGLSAGLDIGFSTLFMLLLFSIAHPWMSPGATHLLVTLAYPVGFLFVILGRSELFTEHTTLALIPVLDRKAKVRALLRLWLVIYLTNLAGAVIVSWLIAWTLPSLGAVSHEAFHAIAHPLVTQPPLASFAGAVFAGWLMGLISWLVAAGKDTTSQIIVIVVATIGIGLGQLPHCIAGTVEVLTALFAGAGPTPSGFFQFLLWATLGNTVGGGVFVAILKYAHVRYRNEGDDEQR